MMYRDHAKLIAEVPQDRPAAEFKLETEFIEPPDDDRPQGMQQGASNSRFRLSLVHAPPEFQVGDALVPEQSITLAHKNCKFSYDARTNGSYLTSIATALHHDAICLELAAVRFVYTGITKASFNMNPSSLPVDLQGQFKTKKGKNGLVTLIIACPTFRAIVTANVYFLPAMFTYLPREPELFSSSEVRHSSSCYIQPGGIQHICNRIHISSQLFPFSSSHQQAQ